MPGERGPAILVRWTGLATVAVTIVVVITLFARDVDPNAFIIATVGLGVASGLLAARTGSAPLPLALLILAAIPTIFGWYLFVYLPLIALLAIGWITAERARPGPG